MSFLRDKLNKLKPHFSEGGRFSKLQSVFQGFESFMFVPDKVTLKGSHIRDSIDLKRTMSVVLIALLPALLFGAWNVGFQHYRSIGIEASIPGSFWFGFLKILPLIIVSYVTGLGIEFIAAQIRGHEINEGFLVTGLLIPLIMPVDIPLWMLALATAFAVILGKEVFGGTGMNIFNPALIARAFLFFSYPAWMTGDKVWTEGLTAGKNVIDGFSGATPLSLCAAGEITKLPSFMHMFIGTIPGSIGETSTLAILLGAIILIVTGIGSWKIIVSVFAGGLGMGLLLNAAASNSYMELPFYYHFVMGGFAFGAVFMATDPVSGAQTEKGKWIYGFMIGVLSILIRVVNPAYPEGVMLAILLMNLFAPLIDYFVIQSSIKKRLKRAKVTIKYFSKMKQFSNRYIFIFSTVMVVAVAILLSLAATLLQPAQEKNLEIEKKKSMLESIGVPATWDNTEELYDKYIKESFVLNSKGEPVEGVDAFKVVLKDEQKKPLEEQFFPVFKAAPDDGEKVIIIPMEGKGLWGPIWGYVSLKSDMNTIYGVTFDHQGETPGLGAEINTPPFEGMFPGKKFFDNDKFVSVIVHKGGADPKDLHGVDAISGGTITSKGLEKMLFDCISKYNDYLLKNRK